MFDAVLIANRGEVAIRIARACRELGVRSVAVYSEIDRDAAHVRFADEAHLLGPTPPAESYLHIGRILEVAAAAGVDAVHPGYGFLAENAAFARAVASADLTFVGPTPETIQRMGDKLSARAVARSAGVAVVPGTDTPVADAGEALRFGEEYGYPVAVKAMFGGGGRGMKVVHDPADMREALQTAERESRAAFGRTECYLERYLARPRHIEIQVLADLDGTTIHLGERDCSLQRRHQKLVEEAPAPGLAEGLRHRLGVAAIDIAREMAYTNAGTCEFLLESPAEDREPDFYFLEMNTRLQVEHPVTELVTGIDLVQAQLRIAAGDGMGLTQRDVATRGHAIEVRINAEEPAAGFLPAPGGIRRLAPPLGPWVRLDAGAVSGSFVPRDYDSLIAKLIVWADTRSGARARMSRALEELVIEGVPTTVPFHRLAMDHPQFAAGTHSTASVEREWDLASLEAQPSDPPGESGSSEPRRVTVEVDGRRLEVVIHGEDRVANGGIAPRRRPRRTAPAGPGGPGGPGSSGRSGRSGGSAELDAPMQGTVVAYAVEVGERVGIGQTVAVLEAMKMENTVAAQREGIVVELGPPPGAVVEAGAMLARIDAPDS